MLTREAILGAKPRLVPVQSKAWGDGLFIKPMSLRARDGFAKLSDELKTSGEFSKLLAKIVVDSLCDENGALLFQPDDLSKIQDKDAGEVDAIAKECLAANGLAETETKKD
jgi:hypothetical protein